MNTNNILNKSANQQYPIYSWIHLEYLTTILQSLLKTDSTAIKEFDIDYATKRGENYSSAMYRAKIKYIEFSQENEISIIIKAKLDDENSTVDRRSYIDYMFVRESQVYKVILNEFQKIMGKSSHVVFAPKLLYLDDRSIVQEDLRAIGYYIKDVKIRLNVDESKLVINKIANFHACAAILYSRKPKLFQHHHVGNITKKFTPFHLIYINSIQSCVRMAKKTIDLQKYVKKLEQFAENIIEKMIRVYSNENAENTFKTLNHGDLWVNNIMFNDDKNDVLLIDYQEGYFGSPGIDLNWFFYSSCNQTVLLSHLNELVTEYHSTLASTLNKFNFTGHIPSLKEVRNEIYDKSDHGIATLLCISPLLEIENIEYADTEMAVSMDEKYIQIRDIVFSNGNYQKLLISILPKFIESGQL